MNIRFTPTALAEMLPTLQQHCRAFSLPIDSFLEDHILASNHYAIRLDDQQIGWAAVYHQSLLTQFGLFSTYKHLGQPIFC